MRVYQRTEPAFVVRIQPPAAAAVRLFSYDGVGGGFGLLRAPSLLFPFSVPSLLFLLTWIDGLPEGTPVTKEVRK